MLVPLPARLVIRPETFSDTWRVSLQRQDRSTSVLSLHLYRVPFCLEYGYVLPSVL